MRIILAGPPKTGNVWVENILAHVYGLEILSRVPSYDFWVKRDIDDLKRFVHNGSFKENSIFHQHFWPTAEFLEFAFSMQCHIVTVIRNPYDTFVSLYYYIQNFADSFISVNDPGVVAIGKPIDHPDVLNFLARDFGVHLVQANEWLRCGKSILVRYEDLHRDALRIVTDVTHQIKPTVPGAVQRAVAASQASELRKRDRFMAKHVRSATVGDWKNHLSAVHLQVFRSCHASLISSLGYEVL